MKYLMPIGFKYYSFHLCAKYVGKTIRALYCDTHYIATSPKTDFNQYPNPNPNPKQYPKPYPNPNTIIYALIKCCRNIIREPIKPEHDLELNYPLVYQEEIGFT